MHSISINSLHREKIVTIYAKKLTIFIVFTIQISHRIRPHGHVLVTAKPSRYTLEGVGHGHDFAYVDCLGDDDVDKDSIFF